MVPYADFLNHENIDTNFDCQLDGKTIELPEMKKKQMDEEEKEEEILRAGNEEKREFMRNINRELLDVEVQLRQKMDEEGHSNQTEEEKSDREMSLQLMKKTAEQIEEMKAEEAKNKEDQEKEEHQGYISSGLESDNDLDLLVEQEVLRSQRARRVRDRIARHMRFAEQGEVAKATGTRDMPLSKEESKNVWDAVVKNVAEEYDFIV
jgi:hypothetical protein